MIGNMLSGGSGGGGMGNGLSTNASGNSTYDWRYIEFPKDTSPSPAEGTESPNLGNWRWAIATSDFSANTGTQIYTDPVSHLGYNIKSGGAVIAGEQAFGLCLEADYWLGGEGKSAQASEIYFEHHNRTNATIIRPHFLQINNDESTAATYGYVIGHSFLMAGVNGGGGISFNSPHVGDQQVSKAFEFVTGIAGSTTTINMYLADAAQSSATLTAPRVLQMSGASNRMELLVGSNATAAVTLWATTTGSVSQTSLSLGGTSSVRAFTDDSGQRAHVLGVDCSASSQTGVVGLKVKAKSTMTPNLVEFQESTGAAQWMWDKNGNVNVATAQTTSAGTGTDTLDTIPGSGAKTPVWVKININGVAHNIPAYPSA